MPNGLLYLLIIRSILTFFRADHDEIPPLLTDFSNPNTDLFYLLAVFLTPKLPSTIILLNFLSSNYYFLFRPLLL